MHDRDRQHHRVVARQVLGRERVERVGHDQAGRHDRDQLLEQRRADTRSGSGGGWPRPSPSSTSSCRRLASPRNSAAEDRAEVQPGRDRHVDRDRAGDRPHRRRTSPARTRPAARCASARRCRRRSAPRTPSASRPKRQFSSERQRQRCRRSSSAARARARAPGAMRPDASGRRRLRGCWRSCSTSARSLKR